VLLTNLGPDSMDFELRGWLRDVNYSLSVRSDLNFEILNAFAKHGIRVQFYGRDLRPTAPAGAGEDA
jgi:small-conductance mechanosensitive channel